MWVALGGAVLGFVSLGSNFYMFNNEAKSAWFGVPHTTELILISALVVLVLTSLTAMNRAPVSGRGVGLIIGAVALVATLQLGYRMLVPPFGGCLHYGCGFDNPRPIGLEAGIWIAFAGTVTMMLGGFLHAASGAAKRTEPRFWIADRQAGVTPWLGIAAVASVAAFFFGFSGLFTFYTVAGFPQEGATNNWAGWISLPHTSVLVVASMLVVSGLVWSAARRRSPLSPGALGGVIAIVGFMAFTRILYRMLDSPWVTAAGGGGDQTHTAAAVTVGWAAYASVAAAAVVTLAGIAQAATHRETAEARAWGERSQPA
ncbi:MAG: hypothetical protein KY463_03885 [Actinobacteria bacterium]|nr:hypothetical protein [Actinomycetota bacterium]